MLIGKWNWILDYDLDRSQASSSLPAFFFAATFYIICNLSAEWFIAKVIVNAIHICGWHVFKLNSLHRHTAGQSVSQSIKGNRLHAICLVQICNIVAGMHVVPSENVIFYKLLWKICEISIFYASARTHTLTSYHISRKRVRTEQWPELFRFANHQHAQTNFFFCRSGCNSLCVHSKMHSIVNTHASTRLKQLCIWVLCDLSINSVASIYVCQLVSSLNNAQFVCAWNVEAC